VTAKIMAALVSAQAELSNPVKSKKANTGTYSYAYVDLAGVIDHVKPTLAKHGLGLMQDVQVTEGRVGITTTLIHSSGESLAFGPLSAAAPVDMQKLGSAITYARRYALVAALGIAADEDDDGAAAKDAPKARPKAVANDDQVLSWVGRISEAGDFIALKKIGHEISEHELDPDVRAELLRQWKERKGALDAP
jgi:hypothetical protein